MPNETENWSAFGVFAAALRDIRRHPVATLVFLGLVPHFWGVLFTWLWHHAADQLAEGSMLPPSAVAGLRQLLGASWRSVALSGTCLLSIDIARGAMPRPARVAEGLKSLMPVLEAVCAPELIAYAVGSFLPLASAAPLLVLPLLVAAVGFLVLVLRGVACISIIVDARRSFPAAFRLSWVWTRPEKWRITRVFLLFSAVLLCAYVLTRKHPVAHALASSVVTAISGLVVAHVYLHLARRHGSASVLEGAPSEVEAPSSGA